MTSGPPQITSSGVHSKIQASWCPLAPHGAQSASLSVAPSHPNRLPVASQVRIIVGQKAQLRPSAFFLECRCACARSCKNTFDRLIKKPEIGSWPQTAHQSKHIIETQLEHGDFKWSQRQNLFDQADSR